MEVYGYTVQRIKEVVNRYNDNYIKESDSLFLSYYF